MQTVLEAVECVCRSETWRRVKLFPSWMMTVKDSADIRSKLCSRGVPHPSSDPPRLIGVLAPCTAQARPRGSLSVILSSPSSKMFTGLVGSQSVIANTS